MHQKKKKAGKVYLLQEGDSNLNTVQAEAGSRHSQPETERLPGSLTHAFGVYTLTLTNPLSLDEKLLRNFKSGTGEVIMFPIKDANQTPMYVVKTWISKGRDYLLSAILQIGQEESGGMAMEICLDAEAKNQNYVTLDRSHWTASLFLSGSLQAVLTSRYVPLRACCNNDGAGTLLHRNPVRSVAGPGEPPRYPERNYSIEMRLATKVLDLGKEGGGRVHTIRIDGRKNQFKLRYVCFVDQTKEVLAIYQHWYPDRGNAKFVGVGNHPELRDLIMGAFVAMGLTSEL